jgi:type IV pilus assembly protein PilQ
VSVNPQVTSVGNTQTINAGGINNVISLLNTRSVSSGLVRMRDGQTLVLSGIIQDQDTVATSKIPILGDLPIIGSLFRRTTRTNQRNEVIVLVTPNIIDDTQPFGYSYYQGQPAPNLPQRN